ncbi:putative Carboxypeptidase Y inhibitor [Sclerotinia borealis F-4128]|uniref:Putative Carboxypeptidase Y inhibitor n=1 Tax=Sclerotinia borealis (strain F-4128) TaxID=1432307 RepID=W9CTD9_SCLBF|nr:putative Carboxypeptidase Y inhibitor [Sclerotinia borealis F-4128]
MQLIPTLTLLLIAGFKLSSALVVSPESYDYDSLESSHTHTDKIRSLKGIQKILKKADIIHDVLDPFIPSCYLAPSYSLSSTQKDVKLGNTIKPAKTQEAPSIKIFCPGKMTVSGGLTIILTDPDAPSRGNNSLSEMCHWIARVPEVVIGKLGIIADLNATDLVSVVDYKAPAPPKGTGKHRYVFVLLEGANDDLKTPEERKHWGFEEPGSGVREWAEREGLSVVGANFHYEKFHAEKESTFEAQFWY